jgi:asparagine synthetase B (glutamine-hydrolysing)
MTVRNVLLSYASLCTDDCAAVFLSGGVDSSSLLFALKEIGKRVTCYSFMLDGRMSSDFSLARRNARTFGAEFVSIILPADVARLKKDIQQLASLGAKKKTDFECGWPMLYAYAAVRERFVFSGMGADGHFCISKKGLLHYKHRIDEFRRVTFGNPGYAQQPLHRRLAERFGKTAVLPYVSKEMQAVFRGKSWDEVNRPRQKQPILDAFPEQYQRMKVLPHTNLQLGDSGIADHFRKLLSSDWNTDGWKSPVGIYNAVVAGRVL